MGLVVIGLILDQYTHQDRRLGLMTKAIDEETGKEYTCCCDEEFLKWVDDCGGRYCTLLKRSWNEWNNEDCCTDCSFTCEGDWD